jgi:hypothetical protein
MSELKYKKGDEFELKANLDSVKGASFSIYPDKIRIKDTVIGDLEPYVLEGYKGEHNSKRNAHWIETYYTKIEPSKLIETDYNGFKDMTDSFGEMLNEKNKRYGNAALDPLVIVGKHHRLGAKIDEKLSRIMNANELKKNDLADIIGYCFLICKDKGWETFDDQLD